MIRVTTFSAAGGHPENEDAFAVGPHPGDPGGRLGFLADGQGGRAGGAAAARVACATAMAEATRRTPRELARAATWVAILRAADRAVADAADAGFTTLIGFGTGGGMLVGASSGDSAVLVRSAGAPATEATGHQAKNPPVGSGAARFIPFSARLIAPWSVLAMSDGVWKYAGWDRLVAAGAAHRGDALVEHVQALARLPRTGEFPDDFTLVVLEAEA